MLSVFENTIFYDYIIISLIGTFFSSSFSINTSSVFLIQSSMQPTIIAALARSKSVFPAKPENMPCDI